jgi:hypothetical protein
MKPIRTVALLASLGALLVAIAIWLVVTRFASNGKLMIDNRTPYATTISISDSGIGCSGDSSTVAPYDVTWASFTLRGPLGLPCVGDEIELIDVANEIGEWQCFWNDEQTHKPMVITESGPTCVQPAGSRLAGSPTP